MYGSAGSALATLSRRYARYCLLISLSPPLWFEALNACGDLVDLLLGAPAELVRPLIRRAEHLRGPLDRGHQRGRLARQAFTADRRQDKIGVRRFQVIAGLDLLAGHKFTNVGDSALPAVGDDDDLGEIEPGNVNVDEIRTRHARLSLSGGEIIQRAAFVTSQRQNDKKPASGEPAGGPECHHRQGNHT